MCRRLTQPYEIPARPPVVVPSASSCSRAQLLALAADAAAHPSALWSPLALPEHVAAILALTGELAREVEQRPALDDLGLDEHTVCLFRAVL